APPGTQIITAKTTIKLPVSLRRVLMSASLTFISCRSTRLPSLVPLGPDAAGRVDPSIKSSCMDIDARKERQIPFLTVRNYCIAFVLNNIQSVPGVSDSLP
ncbi:MAG: hypothetical protein ABR924_06295, partial [Terracidiphilus sp.]